MTKAFDRKLEASLSSAENFFDFYSTNREVKPKELFVRKAKVKEARPYIATHHYSKIMPDSSKEVFMGFYGDTLAGICVFGMGTGKHQYTRLLPDLKDGEYRELTRLWFDGMPKNTESKLIMYHYVCYHLMSNWCYHMLTLPRSYSKYIATNCHMLQNN